MPLSPGSRLGPYEVTAPLGAGGMGEVYLATDTRLRRPVAVKILRGGPTDDSRMCLLREARAAAALNHPNICAVFDVAEFEGLDFAVFEFVEGRTLSEAIPPDGLPLEQVLRYGEGIAGGLAHAHERGIVHRDLKSGNVMIDSDGRLRILDFGIARRLEADSHGDAATTLGDRSTVSGTLAYMSPEALRGEPLDARTDIWSLGIVLFEMVAGGRPFAGSQTFELTASILKDPAPRLPGRVPAGLRSVVSRCLAKDRTDRYQRASEVRAVLEALQAGARTQRSRRQDATPPPAGRTPDSRGGALTPTPPAADAARPSGPVRADERERDLLLQLGAAQGALHGWGALEVEETVRRASSVASRGATDAPAHFDALFLQHTLLYARADFRALRVLDLELERLGADDLTCRICADMGIGAARLQAGELAEARSQLERCVRLSTPQASAVQVARYGLGSAPIAQSFLDIVLTLQGEPERAAREGRDGIEAARALGHPLTLTYALSNAALARLLAGEWQAALRLLREAADLCDRHAIGSFEPTVRTFSARARWGLRPGADVTAQLQEAVGEHGRQGYSVLHTMMLAWIAEAEGASGNTELALATIDESLAAVERHDDRHYEAECHRVKGELLLQHGPGGQASEACFDKALAVARAQGARLWESRAQASVEHLHSRHAAAPPPSVAVPSFANVSPEPEQASIVIVPFEDLSPDPEHAFFADGLTEEIITDLSKVGAMRVISRTSAALLRGCLKDAPAIARQMNVRYVLEGTVRRAGRQLRITTKLIDAATDSALWAEKYAGSLDEVFDIQEKVSQAIVDALKVTLTPEERRRIADRPVANPAAYDCYLRARHEMWRFDEASIGRAIEWTRQALEIVGENDLLYATLGMAYCGYVRAGVRPAASLEEAEACAAKLEALGSRSPGACLLRAKINGHSHSLQAAVRDLKLVLEQDPNHAEALLELAYAYLAAGRVPAARPVLARLLRVDPLTTVNHSLAGWADAIELRFDEALQHYRRAWEMAPDNPLCRFLYGYALGVAGRRDDCLAVFGQLASDWPGTTTGRMALLLATAVSGDEARAVDIARTLEDAARFEEFWAHRLAEGYAQARRKDDAFRWLEHAHSIGSSHHQMLSASWLLAPLHDDPRFADLMGRMKQYSERFEV